MSFEPEIDEDLFEDACDCNGGDCICDEFDIDEEELEDLDEEWEEE